MNSDGIIVGEAVSNNTSRSSQFCLGGRAFSSFIRNRVVDWLILYSLTLLLSFKSLHTIMNKYE